MMTRIRDRISNTSALVEAAVFVGLETIVLFAERIESLDKLLNLLDPISKKTTVIILAFVLAVMFVRNLLKAFAQRSKLKMPERFLIEKDNPAHFKGREEEVRDLGKLVTQKNLIFLEGDSGSGKSALVAVGLRQWCEAEETRPLFVLCDLTGAPWDDGLEKLLSNALYHPLKKLGLDELVTQDKVFDILRQIERKCPRIPLLIFDQFDDYQTIYRQHFYPQGSTLIDSQTFLSENRFWQRIGEGVIQKHWHVLLITRSDTQSSLSVLAYVTPASFTLEHIKPNLIEPLLDEITKPDDQGRAVIEHPKKGWEQLRTVLLDDLQLETKYVLPVQFAVALKGLRELRFLTVGDYRREGGLDGLIRIFIDTHAKRAANAGKVSIKNVLKILFELTDEKLSKTKRIGHEQLVRLLLDINDGQDILDRDRKRAQDALEHLRRNEILRTGTDSLDNIPGDWLLYHDYLALGVVDAQRAAQRWPTALATQARHYLQASTWREKWRALLPAKLLGRLVWETVRGRLQWHEHCQFGWLSSLRIVLQVLGIVICITVVLEFIEDQNDNRAAADLINTLDSLDEISPKELAALENLEARGPRAARLALEQVFRVPASNSSSGAEQDGLASQFAQVSAWVIHLALGIDPTPKRGQNLLHKTVDLERLPMLSESSLLLVTRILTMSVPTIEDASLITEELLSRMKDASNSSSLYDNHRSSSLFKMGKAGATELQIVQGTLSLLSHGYADGDLVTLLGMINEPVHVKNIADSLLAYMEDQRTRAKLVPEYGKALVALVDKGVTEFQIVRGAKILLTRAEYEPYSSPLLHSPNRYGALIALVDKISDDTHVQNLTESLLARMEDEKTNDGLLAEFGQAFVALSGKELSESQIVRAADALLSRLKNAKTSEGILVDLFHAVFALVGKTVGKSQIAQCNDLLLVAMERKNINPYILANLGNALSLMAGKGVNAVQIARGANALIERIEIEDKSTPENAFRNLGQALVALVGKINDTTQAQKLANALLVRMEGKDTPALNLTILSHALAELVGKGANESQTAWGVNALLGVMEDKETDRRILDGIGQTLIALVGKVNDITLAQKLANDLLSTMEDKNISPIILARLGSALAAMSEDVSQLQIARGADLLLSAMGDKNTSQDEFGDLGDALAAVARRGVSDSQIARSVDLLLAALQKGNGESYSYGVFQALVALVGSINDITQTQNLADTLLAMIENMNTPAQYLAKLGKALIAFVDKGVGDAQIARGTAALLVRMKDKSISVDDLVELSQTMINLAVNGSNEKQVEWSAALSRVIRNQDTHFQWPANDKMVAFLSHAPLKEQLLAIKSAAGVSSRELLTRTLSTHVQAEKPLSYWEALQLAKTKNPSLFAEVAAD